MRRRSLSGTPSDGAVPMEGWILGTVEAIFPFAIVLLCIMLIVSILMVHIILFLWSLSTPIHLSKRKSHNNNLDERRNLPLFGGMTEPEIVLFSNHKLFLEKLLEY